MSEIFVRFSPNLEFVDRFS